MTEIRKELVEVEEELNQDRACLKYDQRISGMEKGIFWSEIKTEQEKLNETC